MCVHVAFEIPRGLFVSAVSAYRGLLPDTWPGPTKCCWLVSQKPIFWDFSSSWLITIIKPAYLTQASGLLLLPVESTSESPLPLAAAILLCAFRVVVSSFRKNKTSAFHFSRLPMVSVIQEAYFLRCSSFLRIWGGRRWLQCTLSANVM